MTMGGPPIEVGKRDVTVGTCAPALFALLGCTLVEAGPIEILP